MFKSLTNKIYPKLALGGMVYVLVGYLSTLLAAEETTTTPTTTPITTAIQTPIESSTKFGPPVDEILELFNWLFVAVNGILAHVLGAVSVFLNTAIKYSIIQFSDSYKFFEGSVGNAWLIFRDISNILIIALFFAVAIGIIVGSEKFGDKSLLIKLFLVALLVNFSAFFTKVLIDLSNITILFFYSSLVGETSLPSVIIKSASVIEIASQSFFEASVGVSSLLIANIIKTFLFLLFIFLFVYLAIAFMIRFIVLLFAIIMSPIGIIGFFLHKIDIGFLDSIYKEWIKLLKFGAIWPILIFVLLNISVDLAAGSQLLLRDVIGAGGTDPSSILAVSLFGVLIGTIPLYYAVILTSQLMGEAVNKKLKSAAKWGLRKARSTAWRGTKGLARGAGGLARGALKAGSIAANPGAALSAIRSAGGWKQFAKNPIYSTKKIKSHYGKEMDAEEGLKGLSRERRKKVRTKRKVIKRDSKGKIMRDKNNHIIMETYTLPMAQKEEGKERGGDLRFGSANPQDDNAKLLEAVKNINSRGDDDEEE